MTPPTPDSAKSRFAMLQLLRLGGFVAAVAGIWLWRDAAQAGDSEAPGKVLFVVGLFGSLVVPALLARRWRSRDQ